MIPLDTWLLFCVACVALVATPGPNMLYLVSRTLAQGRAAGFVSLAGTSTGFALHALAAAFGLSALLAAVPLAYDACAWRGRDLSRVARVVDVARAATTPATRPSPRRASRRRAMYRQGLLTAVLNPKVALFQLALFPQFVDPAHGSVLAAEPRARADAARDRRRRRFGVRARRGGARRWFARASRMEPLDEARARRRLRGARRAPRDRRATASAVTLGAPSDPLCCSPTNSA